jgi:hypothetical protein
VRRFVRILALLGFTAGYSVLLEWNFRAIYGQTFFYTWCQIANPWDGWLNTALLSGALLALAALHIALSLPSVGALGTVSLVVITATSLWVGLWAYVAVVLSSDEAIVLSSPTAIPFLQGMATVVLLRIGRRWTRKNRLIAVSGAVLGLPALWLVVNYLVAQGVCSQS